MEAAILRPAQDAANTNRRFHETENYAIARKQRGICLDAEVGQRSAFSPNEKFVEKLKY